MVHLRTLMSNPGGGVRVVREGAITLEGVGRFLTTQYVEQNSALREAWRPRLVGGGSAVVHLEAVIDEESCSPRVSLL